MQVLPKSVQTAHGGMGLPGIRLQPIIKTWVKSPTTQPRGTRSIYFRDPDGNLVDFFTRVKP
jgi:catechol 2,3-dioxygenase-like lactoylglutathione lyase family enzyme